MSLVNSVKKKIYKAKCTLAERRKRDYSGNELKEIIKRNDQRFHHNVTKNQLTFSRDTSRSILSNCLKENGIVIIEHLISRDIAVKAGLELEQLILRLKKKLESDKFYEESDVAAQLGNERLRGYMECVNFGKPLLTIRRPDKKSIDGGMIDFFNVDNLLNNEEYPNLKICNSRLQELDVKSLIASQTKKSITQHPSNVYYNEGVVNPRKLHIDSVNEIYKSFIYLTDVKDEEDGPYRFVPRSHVKYKAKEKSYLQNLRVSNVYNPEDVLLSNNLSLPFIGLAGSIAITYQNGVHGGTPQSDESRRCILVSNYS